KIVRSKIIKIAFESLHLELPQSRATVRTKMLNKALDEKENLKTFFKEQIQQNKLFLLMNGPLDQTK
ncbi:MAG: hypothetical protein MHPSP_004502, partial [Paramarteilia canceri]